MRSHRPTQTVPTFTASSKVCNVYIVATALLARVCVCVRVKSVSTATPTGSMQPLFLYLSTSCMLLRCLLLHVACVDIFATPTFYILQQFLGPLPPSSHLTLLLQLYHDLILHNLLSAALPSPCIFCNPIVYRHI